MSVEDVIVLSDAPLPESETATTLDAFDEEPSLKRGGELLKKKGVEGRIIFDPGRCLIFSIPPGSSIASESLLTPDRRQWDLYLIIIPFTLHEAPDEGYYEKLIFLVDLSNSLATAFDLFPRQVVGKGEATKTYILESSLKIGEVNSGLNQRSKAICFATLHPKITAFGEGRNLFYWVYEGSQEQAEVIPETKYAMVVLQVPLGAPSVSGTIEYELIVVRRIYGIWTRKEVKTSALPIHWNLKTAQSLLERDSIGTTQETMHPASPAYSAPEVLRCEVLLVTATQVELEAVLTVFQEELNRSFKRMFLGEKTYYDLGTIGGAHTLLVQSEMGSGGPGGSLLTVQEGIRALRPSAVVMVGIAFGNDSKKQRLGEILVSRQIVGYELQRIGLGADDRVKISLRGDRPQASVWLLDRFRSGLVDWRGPKVHIGLILSGEKLVDHQAFRELLCTFEPEALGGEMEGAGVYAAAQRNKVDWILIKAICDWADGKKAVNKSQRQQLAARNAANFTLHVLKQGGFATGANAPGDS